MRFTNGTRATEQALIPRGDEPRNPLPASGSCRRLGSPRCRNGPDMPRYGTPCHLQAMGVSPDPQREERVRLGQPRSLTAHLIPSLATHLRHDAVDLGSEAGGAP